MKTTVFLKLGLYEEKKEYENYIIVIIQHLVALLF